MPHRALLEEFEYAQARQGRLEAYCLEIIGRTHLAHLSVTMSVGYHIRIYPPCKSRPRMSDPVM
jgi:hypothetical protein